MKLPKRRVRQPGLRQVPQEHTQSRRSHVVRPMRAARRGATILLCTLPAAAVQAACLLMPGRPKVVFARLYWAGMCRLMGLQVRVIGTQARRLDGRAVVFASNHSSWLDVLALGGVLDACFIAKAEVGRWPLVLPPLIQPVSVVYDQLAGLPMGRASRPVFAWYGDMDLGSHFWQLAQHRGLRATVLLHTPVDPAAYPSRKALSQAVWQTVAEGAATLRQNRPVLAPVPVAVPTGQPAFA